MEQDKDYSVVLKDVLGIAFAGTMKEDASALYAYSNVEDRLA